MGLFGNWRQKVQKFAPAWEDIGDTLQGVDGHAVADVKAKADQDAWLTQLPGLLGAPTPGAASPSMPWAAGAQQAPTPGHMASPIDIYLAAAKLHQDPGNALAMYQAAQPKPHDYQWINGKDGGVGRGDSTTGEYMQVQAPTFAPAPPVKPQTIEGPDGIYERNPDTGEWVKKTKWAQFNPYHGKGGGGSSSDSSDAPPAGYVLD